MTFIPTTSSEGHYLFRVSIQTQNSLYSARAVPDHEASNRIFQTTKGKIIFPVSEAE